MTMSANLQKLQAAGVDLDKVSQAQRDVLSSLTPTEIDTMISIKKRLEAPVEVQGYAATSNPGVGVAFF